MHSPMCNNGLEFVALLLNNGEEEIVLDGKNVCTSSISHFHFVK